MPGNPALYTVGNGSTAVISLTNIQLLGSNGTAATNWQLVTGDAESTDTSRIITWQSDQVLNLLRQQSQLPGGQRLRQRRPIRSAQLQPQRSHRDRVHDGASASTPRPRSTPGPPCFEAKSPTSLTITLVAGGLQATFLGVLLAMTSATRAYDDYGREPEGAARSSRRRHASVEIPRISPCAVIGVAAVAILLAFATSISGSGEHRTLVTLDTMLRTVSAQATADDTTAAAQAPSRRARQRTAEHSRLRRPSPSPPAATATISGVQYWNGTGWTPSRPQPPTTSCPSGAQATFQQQVTITVTKGTAARPTSVVADPIAPNASEPRRASTRPRSWPGCSSRALGLRAALCSRSPPSWSRTRPAASCRATPHR